MPSYIGITHVPQTAENLSKLLEVIDLILKKFEVKSKFRDAYYFEISNSNIFKKIETLGKKSISLANDCIRSHRFEDAAKLLWIVCQDRTNFEPLLFNGMMLVLENLQISDKDNAVFKMCSDIQDQMLTNKLDVQLEYILYALRNDVHNIPESFEKVSSKRRNNRLKKIPAIEHAHAAYCALLDYIVWHSSCQDETLSTHSKNIADKAVSNIRNVIDHPGTWDIFILKLIEILEHYGNYDEITTVLKKYAERNPQHVNALIYLCVHLHRYGKDQNEVIYYAKEISKICPSDIRVLLLVHIWKEQGKKFEERLKLLFMYLDYPVNGKDILGWQMLSSHLCQVALSTNGSSNLVQSLWSLRCQAWNYMYFQRPVETITNQRSLKLIAYKVQVVSFLDPGHEYIQNAPDNISELCNDGSEQSNFANFYNLNEDIHTRECL